MRTTANRHALQRQADTLRSFNRYYTMRLGLLRGRYLDSDFSLTEARILYELAHGLGITAATLRRSLSLDAGYISRLLASLEKRGLLGTKPSRLDRRALLLKLTPSGKRTTAHLSRQSSREMEQLLQTVPAAERLDVTQSLIKVQRILSSAEHARDQKSPVKVIRATLSHATDARTLLNEYYREVNVTQRDTPNTVHNFLSSPDSALWIAYVGDTPAGCVVLRPLEVFRHAAECKRLYVRAQFRRQGIAEALLDAMENYARKSSLRWIYLDSKDDLQVAIALYRRRGYEPCKRYNDNPQATIFFRKSIKRPSSRDSFSRHS
jgi:DNA-binding MarR family transcriptional regulator/ribosomal protein S18 acetylase RimI-like enzyme